jgi:hypothetical protein
MPDFSKIWATNSPLPEFNFTDEEYLEGWDFVDAAPPTKNQFDAWFRETDKKLKWLYDQLQNTATQIYPVGSVYISFNSANPATLFGGVWQRLKDTFLLANGDAYAPNTTGGSATKTITVNNMPAHNHTVNESGNHYHDASTSWAGNHSHTRGSMNITGWFSNEALPGGVSGAAEVGGAFYLSPTGRGHISTTVAGGNSNYSFEASRTWGGETSWNGNHYHTLSTSWSGNHSHTTNNTGDGLPLNIMPPYTTVYMWLRTA